jgi:hypothetical protein
MMAILSRILDAKHSQNLSAQHKIETPNYRFFGHDVSQVLNKPQIAESAPVSHSGFFTSIGHDQWSGSAQLCNSRKVKAASRLSAVLKFLTALSTRATFNDQIGANTMARTKRTRARFTFSAYTFARRFFGPVASFRIASMGGK